MCWRNRASRVVDPCFRTPEVGYPAFAGYTWSQMLVPGTWTYPTFTLVLTFMMLPLEVGYPRLPAPAAAACNE